MEQYIPKSVLVAEIKRRLKFVEERLQRNNSYTEDGNTAWKRDKALYDTYIFILSFIDTLEVKEVDLEKEEYQVSQSFEGEGLFDGNKVVLKAQK